MKFLILAFLLFGFVSNSHANAADPSGLDISESQIQSLNEKQMTALHDAVVDFLKKVEEKTKYTKGLSFSLLESAFALVENGSPCFFGGRASTIIDTHCSKPDGGLNSKNCKAGEFECDEHLFLSDKANVGVCVTPQKSFNGLTEDCARESARVNPWWKNLSTKERKEYASGAWADYFKSIKHFCRKENADFDACPHLKQRIKDILGNESKEPSKGGAATDTPPCDTTGMTLEVGTKLKSSKAMTLKSNGKLVFRKGKEPTEANADEFFAGAGCFLRRPTNETLGKGKIDMLEVDFPAGATFTITEDVKFSGKLHRGSYYKVTVNPSVVVGSHPMEFPLMCETDVKYGGGDNTENKFLDFLTPNLCPVKKGQTSHSGATDARLNQGHKKPGVQAVTEGNEEGSSPTGGKAK